MNNDLTISKAGEIQQRYNLGTEEIQTLIQSNIIPQGTPEGQIKMFARFCAESSLSPFKHQVHLIRRGDKFTIQTGIDGYRAIANRTGLYAGNDKYVFDEGISEFEIIKAGRKNPTIATSTVYRLVGGVRCPFSADARWEEYVQTYNGKLGNMWEKMPFLMLGKCAEALALRKAFPEELGGIYTDEEMLQADNKLETFSQEQPKTSVRDNVSFAEFDCKVEKISFGKYKGMEWITLDRSYLNWLVKDGQPEAKKRAEMTLKYLEAGEVQQSQEADPLDNVFNKSEGEKRVEDVGPSFEVEQQFFEEYKESIGNAETIEALKNIWLSAGKDNKQGNLNMIDYNSLCIIKDKRKKELQEKK